MGAEYCCPFFVRQTYSPTLSTSLSILFQQLSHYHSINTMAPKATTGKGRKRPPPSDAEAIQGSQKALRIDQQQDVSTSHKLDQPGMCLNSFILLCSDICYPQSKEHDQLELLLGEVVKFNNLNERLKGFVQT